MDAKQGILRWSAEEGRWNAEKGRWQVWREEGGDAYVVASVWRSSAGRVGLDSLLSLSEREAAAVRDALCAVLWRLPPLDAEEAALVQVANAEVDAKVEASQREGAQEVADAVAKRGGLQ